MGAKAEAVEAMDRAGALAIALNNENIVAKRKAAEAAETVLPSSPLCVLTTLHVAPRAPRFPASFELVSVRAFLVNPDLQELQAITPGQARHL